MSLLEQRFVENPEKTYCLWELCEIENSCSRKSSALKRGFFNLVSLSDYNEILQESSKLNFNPGYNLKNVQNNFVKLPEYHEVGGRRCITSGVATLSAVK